MPETKHKKAPQSHSNAFYLNGFNCQLNVQYVISAAGYHSIKTQDVGSWGLLFSCRTITIDDEKSM